MRHVRDRIKVVGIALKRFFQTFTSQLQLVLIDQKAGIVRIGFRVFRGNFQRAFEMDLGLLAVSLLSKKSCQSSHHGEIIRCFGNGILP